MSSAIRLMPIEKAVSHNVAVTANTDILAATIAPTFARTAVLFRLMVSLDVGGIFRARITRSAVTVTVDFNNGFFLIPNALYIFDFLMHTGDTVNFRHSATGNALVLRVEEIGGEV